MADPQQLNKRSCMRLFAICICILIIALTTNSFSYIQYYEMGFLKSVTTGKVEVTTVYSAGRYLIGPGKTFKKFRADAHGEYFNRISVFNKQKLSVTMTCSLQYFLYPDELQFLHDEYGSGYRPVLRQTLQAAIKSTAAQFTVDEFRLERPKVAKGLADAASLALGGICCRKNCTSVINCTRQDRGRYAEVRYFQLELVNVTKEQEKKFLRQVIETEKQDTERFKQHEQVTKKETELWKGIIENEALEISQNATAQANFIKSAAEAEARSIVERARNSGLEIVYKVLNITNAEHKKSFEYIRTLRESNVAQVYIGFSTMVAKP